MKYAIAIAMFAAAIPAFAEDATLPGVTVIGSRSPGAGVAGSGFGVLNMSIVPRGSVVTYGSANIDNNPSQPLGFRPRFPSAAPGTPAQVVGGVAAMAGILVPPPVGTAITVGGIAAATAGTAQSAMAGTTAGSGTFPVLSKLGNSRN